MKTKQPDHCAHVARYYADKANTMAKNPSNVLFGLPAIYLPHSGVTIAEDLPDPRAAVNYLQRAIAFIRLATKFWLRAGGEIVQVQA